MKLTLLTRRYLLFLTGLIVCSVGVALITKANLGTSPVTSTPYVLSLQFAPTIGMFTVIINLVFMAGQLVLLRGQFRPHELLQLPFSFLMGYFIDLMMWLFAFVNPSFYPLQLLVLLLGCATLGLGIYFQVCAQVLLLPGEAFVRAIAIRLHREFSQIKPWFDSSMAVIAIVLSFLFFQELIGVREGTLISALILGRFVGLYVKCLPKIRDIAA